MNTAAYRFASCTCCHFSPQRRLFGGALLAGAASLAAGTAWAREGVDVGPPSSLSQLVSADQVEKAAVQQYRQLQQGAAQKNALAPDDHPQEIRLRAIAQRLIPFTYEWNERARSWKWEANVIGSKQINAFCMPRGKIAFYYGILDQLKLTHDRGARAQGAGAAWARCDAGPALGAGGVDYETAHGVAGNEPLVWCPGDICGRPH